MNTGLNTPPRSGQRGSSPYLNTINRFVYFQSQEDALLKASIEADLKNAENKRKTLVEEIENAALQKRKDKENLINDLVIP